MLVCDPHMITNTNKNVNTIYLWVLLLCGTTCPASGGELCDFIINEGNKNFLKE
jgi:hypothetical protein